MCGVTIQRQSVNKTLLGKSETCGGYTIIKTLGKGGNSVVKLVEKDEKLYAMKIFKTERVRDYAKFI